MEETPRNIEDIARLRRPVEDAAPGVAGVDRHILVLERQRKGGRKHTPAFSPRHLKEEDVVPVGMHGKALRLGRREVEIHDDVVRDCIPEVGRQAGDGGTTQVNRVDDQRPTLVVSPVELGEVALAPVPW